MDWFKNLISPGVSRREFFRRSAQAGTAAGLAGSLPAVVPSGLAARYGAAVVGGVITSITVTHGGSGYTSAPTVSFPTPPED